MNTRQFRIGRLANLGQVIKALGKTIRAMADGSIDSQVGGRICNGLGIMRACLEVGLRLGWSPPRGGARTSSAQPRRPYLQRPGHGLGIMRAYLETLKLEQLEARMDEIADRVAHDNPLRT